MIQFCIRIALKIVTKYIKGYKFPAIQKCTNSDSTVHRVAVKAHRQPKITFPLSTLNFKISITSRLILLFKQKTWKKSKMIDCDRIKIEKELKKNRKRRKIKVQIEKGNKNLNRKGK